jgi:hypothetical protein
MINPCSAAVNMNLLDFSCPQLDAGRLLAKPAQEPAEPDQFHRVSGKNLSNR